MYDDQQQTDQKKKVLKVLFISAIVIFSIWLITTLALNGFVDSSSLRKEYSLEFNRIDNGKVAETTMAKPGYTRLHTGDYNVKITADNSRSYSTVSIHVDNLFRISKLNFSEKKQSDSQYIFATTEPSFVTGTNKLASYTVGGSSITDDNSPLSSATYTCEWVCMSLYPYDDNQLIGLLGDQTDTKSVAVITPPETTPSNIDQAIYPSGSTLIRSLYDKSFAVYSGDARLYYYKDISSKPVEVKLDINPAQGQDDYLISINDDSILVASGIDYSIPTSGDGGYGTTNEEPADYILDTYSVSTRKKTTSFALKQHAQIRAISISPDEKHYTVSSLSTFEIGDTSNGRVTATKPYDISSAAWVDSTRFVYYDTSAVYMADITGTTWPIFANQSMSISNIDFVSGKLHVSAIFTDDPDQQLNAIIVDTSKVAVDNSLLSYNPLKQTDYYSIRFDGQKFMLYINSNQDGSKPGTEKIDSAYTYIKNKAPNAQIVVFE